MPEPAKDRLSRVFAEKSVETSDSAGLSLPADILDLYVDGVGQVGIPVRSAGAKKLIAVAQPAMFGRGEETILDTEVRDTWELTPAQVQLGGQSWESSLASALEKFRARLGLPNGFRLRAELHSMLVYGKDQFFLPHQDSEKHDDMVATLVLSLPSAHTGGELVIDDSGTERTYRASRDELTLVAFYADRRHEVKPVRSGHRVTLTFNLLLEVMGASAAAKPGHAAKRDDHGDGAADQVRMVCGLLTEHFATATRGPYGIREPRVPTHLAFLLDHEYSQRGLAIPRLKGADADRVRTLIDAADQADCEAVLALMEITETRDTFDRYRGDHDAMEDEDLLDGSHEVTFWKNPDGSHAADVSLSLTEEEISRATPTRTLDPYEEEYEGYMGNYGNTVERWYRRAAVVLWPRQRAFAARAKADFAWGLDTLAAMVAADKTEEAREGALSLAPFWSAVGAEHLSRALVVAVDIGDPQAAAVLLAPFGAAGLGPDDAGAVVALRSNYGLAWWRGLLDLWAPRGSKVDPWVVLPGEHSRMLSRVRSSPVSAEWVASSLLPLSEALRRHGKEGKDCADTLVAQIWAGTKSAVELAARDIRVNARDELLTHQGEPVARTLEAASAGQAEEMVGWLLGFECSRLPLLLSTVRSLVPTGPAASGQMNTLAERWRSLAAACEDSLTTIVTAPERAPDDWSIEWSGCGCADCETLAEFLRAEGEQKREWPLAKPRRQHIHRQIDDAELPLTHMTRRQGSPHMLVLNKTQELFSRETQRRTQASADLEWLGAVNPHQH